MCAPFDTETSNFIMKSAIKPAMMCLIILKRLFFNSEVMLPCEAGYFGHNEGCQIYQFAL